MKKLIAGNWKMHKTIAEGVAFVKALKVDKRPNRGVLLCVPATMLKAVAEAAKGTDIKVGAENMHYAESGAFTGEISPLMVKDAGADFVLVGHSERRAIFGESDEFINKKVKSALEHGITPVLCIGETLEEREGGKLESVLKTQLTEAFKAEKNAWTHEFKMVWFVQQGAPALLYSTHVYSVSGTLLKVVFHYNIVPAMVPSPDWSVKAKHRWPAVFHGTF